MASVALREVVKVYENGVTAVDKFSLHIEDGELVVLVGPSGCGKSTLLRAIAGLEELTSGEIEIDGRLMNEVSPKDRDLAMVFQSYALYPHMSVFDNIAFGLRMRGAQRNHIERSVSETAQMLGIETLLDRKPKQLSGGQRQRVALGRAIVRRPKCFLFDEPLSNLDAKLRGLMRTEIRRLQLRLRTTSIYVTHDQEEAMTLGDRIVVMRKGVVQQVGTPLEIYERPVNRFVASFLGTPEMNFIEGAIRRDPCIQFTASGCSMPLDPGRIPANCPAQVLLGIRPQSLRVVPVEGAPICAMVELVEILGDRMDVFASVKDQRRLVIRTDANPGMRPGDRIGIAPDHDRLHWFTTGEDGTSLI